MKKLDVSLNSIEPLIQKISELTKIQRIIICCVIVVLIIAGFVFGLYKPTYEKITKLKKEIAAEEETLKKNKASAAQFAEYKKKMEAAQAKFNIVAKALPKKKEVPSLLTNISQVGKDSGLAFLLFKPVAEKKKDFYAEIPIKMKLSGSYHDLGTFFDQLAGMSRIVNIKSVNMKKARGSRLNINCTAATYRFIEPQPDKKKKGKKGKKRKKGKK